MRKTIYWIEGDGIGPEIWRAARPVIDAALAAESDMRLDWRELLAGEKAREACGSPLPEATLKALSGADIAMKGPLGTPVGTGIRSLNVALRQGLDLYACIRPVRHIPGLETPVKHPERVDMVIFRENTEDVYAGVEFAAGHPLYIRALRSARQAPSAARWRRDGRRRRPQAGVSGPSS